MVIRKLFTRAEAAPRQHRLPAGQRLYAIGDIHGRRDCLDDLLDRINADDAARETAETTLVFLGDLADRGADSRGVIERAMEIVETRRAVFLMGNHEEILISAWEGDRRSAGLFNRVGGRETLMSYGVSDHDYDRSDLGELATLTAERVPAAHIAFLRRFVDSYTVGDYLFVHAGIRPGVELAAQHPSDLRWIRRDFLDDRRDHGPMVVHGHSITEDVDERPNRIGIDTGAFASGRLTALGIEGTERWFLST
ncbi:MAG: serine/threonine protein phosphatase [Sphingomonadaceae bacterium]|nr:serine/threonine protein phosphatase [Sphingomonadaceae bacterium]